MRRNEEDEYEKTILTSIKTGNKRKIYISKHIFTFLCNKGTFHLWFVFYTLHLSQLQILFFLCFVLMKLALLKLNYLRLCQSLSSLSNNLDSNTNDKKVSFFFINPRIEIRRFQLDVLKNGTRKI